MTQRAVDNDPQPFTQQQLVEHFRATRDWASELSRNAAALAHQCQKLMDRLEPPDPYQEKR